jgi:hypothetical protein
LTLDMIFCHLFFNLRSSKLSFAHSPLVSRTDPCRGILMGSRQTRLGAAIDIQINNDAGCHTTP